MTVPTFDEDHLEWRLIDTALFRRRAAPVFLSPVNWPQRTWLHGDCLTRAFRVVLRGLPVKRKSCDEA